MNHPNQPQRPKDQNTEKEKDDNSGGETFGNEAPVQDPKKNPRDPDKYEMNPS